MNDKNDEEGNEGASNEASPVIDLELMFSLAMGEDSLDSTITGTICDCCDSVSNTCGTVGSCTSNCC